MAPRPDPPQEADAGQSPAPDRQQGAGASPLSVAAGLGAIAAAAGIVASAVRSKAAAAFLGPSGVGMVAEIQQVATLGLIPLSAFAGPALVRGLAQQQAHLSSWDAFRSALSWTVAIGTALSVAVTLASPWVLPSPWGGDKTHLVLLATTTVMVTAVLGVLNTTLVHFGAYGQTTRLQLAVAVGSAAALVSLTWAFGLEGPFVAGLLVPLAVLPWAAVAARRHFTRGDAPQRVTLLHRGYLVDSLKFGAAALATTAAGQSALAAIRWRLEVAGGPALNGQFQASWAVGAVYLSMVLNGIANFAFPRFAAARDSQDLAGHVDEAAKFVLRVAPPVVLLALCFSDVGIRILYSSRFDTAIRILRWQLAGDVAKCLSWVYAGPLLYRGRIRAVILTEVFAALLLAGSAWALVSAYGVEGTGIAYFLTYLFYLPMTALVLRVVEGIRIVKRDLLAALAWTVGLGAVAPVAGSPFVRAAALAAAFAWSWRSGSLSSLVRRIRRVVAPNSPSAGRQE